MGEKGNAAEAMSGAGDAGSSLVGKAGTATANIVLDTGEELRGKLIEGAAEGAVERGRERIRRRPGDDEGSTPK